MADAVIVAYKDGAEYEVESASVAKRLHPDATIVRFAATQEPYKEGTHPTPPASAPVEVAIPSGDLTETVPDEAGQSMTGGTTATKAKA